MLKKIDIENIKTSGVYIPSENDMKKAFQKIRDSRKTKNTQIEDASFIIKSLLPLMDIIKSINGLFEQIKTNHGESTKQSEDTMEKLSDNLDSLNKMAETYYSEVERFGQYGKKLIETIEKTEKAQDLKRKLYLRDSEQQVKNLEGWNEKAKKMLDYITKIRQEVERPAVIVKKAEPSKEWKISVERDDEGIAKEYTLKRVK